MATANFYVEPQDGWVAVASDVAFIRISQFPHRHAFWVTTDSQAPSTGSAATGTITFSGQPTAADTITVGSSVFTFVETTPAGDDEVEIGADAEETLDNLLAAITALAGDTVTATKSGTTIIDLAAVEQGPDGNSIVLTESADNVTVSGSGTLEGGSDPVLGFMVDCEEEFWCDVPISDTVYVRTTNPTPDSPLRIDVFYVAGA